MKTKQLKLRHHAISALLASAAMLSASSTATAATATGSLPVRIQILGTCSVVTGGLMDFGVHGSILSGVDAAGTLVVNCTSGISYTVELDAGAGSGATVALRKMTLSGVTIDYELYTDSARTTLWGDGTAGTSVLSASGTGVDDTLNVYGRVIAQTTPSQGTYNDTVTATIIW